MPNSERAPTACSATLSAANFPSHRAGQVLELAVFLAVKQGDEAAFERNYAQLRVYYSDARGLAGLAPSGQEATLTGLNLLRLLVANRIAEFHSELEVGENELGGAGQRGFLLWFLYMPHGGLFSVERIADF